RRPAPGAPPFVEEGSLVEENTTIALIEVMKLFTPIKAGVKGRIRRICAENNDLVEYDQVLFLVEPE
ncbi:MAG: acetyl-CoA carboxylase, biotin carboxyl carrier protein, partial [Lysobacteraceae bacterium]